MKMLSIFIFLFKNVNTCNYLVYPQAYFSPKILLKCASFPPKSNSQRSKSGKCKFAMAIWIHWISWLPVPSVNMEVLNSSLAVVQ